jgi:hypothetical protein
MKVAQVKELLNAYSDEDELMIVWNDKTQFEYVLDKELPNEIWQEAVRVFDRADLMDFNDECHSLVVVAKDKVMENQ